MTPSEYCLTRVDGPGGDLYYALRHLPAAPRDAVTALYALAVEIGDSARECHDPQLAHTKLAWWRGEIERAARDRASHPVTQTLAPWLRQDLLPLPPLMQLVDAATDDVGPVRVRSFDELRSRLRHSHGEVAALAATLRGARDATTLDHARALGTLYGATRTLAEAGADLRANRVYLPADELAHFGLADRDPVGCEDTGAWRSFMVQQVDRLTRLHRETLIAVPAEHADALLADRILATLQQALLDEIRAIDYRVLSQRVTLTPLRRLWIAWRVRWQSRRSKPGPRLG
jgi:phytoene synthase